MTDGRQVRDYRCNYNYVVCPVYRTATVIRKNENQSDERFGV